MMVLATWLGNLMGLHLSLSNNMRKPSMFCMNHRLNLCVADTCSSTLVRNMMGVVKKLSDFFSNSPKRQDYLIKKIEALLPGSNHHILIDVCRTRWIARIDGMDRIAELLLPVVSTLEDISLNRVWQPTMELCQ